MRYNKVVTKILKEFRKKNDTPTMDDVHRLADTCNLTRFQIKQWFRNKKYRETSLKEKKKIHKKRFNVSAKRCLTTVNKLKRWLSTANRYYQSNTSDSSSESSWENTQSEDEDDYERLTLVRALSDPKITRKLGSKENLSKTLLGADDESTTMKTVYGMVTSHHDKNCYPMDSDDNSTTSDDVRLTDQQLTDLFNPEYDMQATSAVAALRQNLLNGAPNLISGVHVGAEAGANLLHPDYDLPSTSGAAALRENLMYGVKREVQLIPDFISGFIVDADFGGSVYPGGDIDFGAVNYAEPGGDAGTDASATAGIDLGSAFVGTDDAAGFNDNVGIGIDDAAATTAGVAANVIKPIASNAVVEADENDVDSSLVLILKSQTDTTSIVFNTNTATTDNDGVSNDAVVADNTDAKVHPGNIEISLNRDSDDPMIPNPSEGFVFFDDMSNDAVVLISNTEFVQSEKVHVQDGVIATREIYIQELETQETPTEAMDSEEMYAEQEQVDEEMETEEQEPSVENGDMFRTAYSANEECIEEKLLEDNEMSYLQEILPANEDDFFQKYIEEIQEEDGLDIHVADSKVNPEE